MKMTSLYEMSRLRDDKISNLTKLCTLFNLP